MGNAEGKIESYLISEAQKNNFLCIKLTGEIGVPDRLLVVKGCQIFIELKADGVTTPSKAQIEYIKKLKSLNATVLVINSKDQVDQLMSIVTKPKFSKKELEKITIEIKPKKKNNILKNIKITKL